MGAPERLLPQIDVEESSINRARRLSEQGYRVLAFAQTDQMPDGDTTHIASALQPVALVVMSDKVREDIQETLNAFRDENIALKVISGDSLETVRAVATQAGMDAGQSYTGEQLEAMTEGEFDSVVLQANAFARIEPDTKQRIIASLQKQKNYVAMVGDGVNDVPALKQANLAIVMNDGTQISKDVADIVLLNNAMSTLPRAFREGKETTQTIFGTMKMFLVKSFYNVALFVFIAFMSLPFPITPVQISWSTFGTVNLPATLIAFGLLRPKYMRNFRHDVLDFVFTGGVICSVLSAVIYVVAYFSTDGDLMATRSTITIFLSLFGAYVVCAIQGVDFYRPRTFIEHGPTVIMMTVLATLTILVMYAVPTLFEFRPLSWEAHAPIIITVALLFSLSIVLLAHGMKYRYLLHRLWRLFQRGSDLSARRSNRAA